MSARVWQQKGKDCCHFWTVTEWVDIASIKAFAGEDYEKAKYYLEDDSFLLKFEEMVNHYETFPVSA